MDQLCLDPVLEFVGSVVKGKHRWELKNTHGHTHKTKQQFWLTLFLSTESQVNAQVCGERDGVPISGGAQDIYKSTNGQPGEFASLQVFTGREIWATKTQKVQS